MTESSPAKPAIAISMGDFHGVGPEIVVKAFARSDLFELCIPIVFGSVAALSWHVERTGAPVKLREVTGVSQAEPGEISVLDTGGSFDPLGIGQPAAEGGAASIAAIERAFEAVASGEAKALVTAPISKEAIALAGSPFKGHTDMLAALCGAESVLMLMCSNTMKVGLVTIHVPVGEVAPLITGGRISKTIEAGARALAGDFGIPRPRIAVLALNPHAGDGGFLGTEERDIIIPAIRKMAGRGIPVEGPFAADGFFSAHNKQLFDLIIAMYHDQGLIPFKMQAAGRGVNVSCGLPIVRTSPDHGTAYDIAGKGAASAESMKEAIVTARGIFINRTRNAAGNV
jgi:4-phospho-D-threonate 3-dehydrogenase / 4-phospho-D-erythronate 3-dehydrogenase